VSNGRELGEPAGGGPVELSHVHGLGVDPGDGEVYAGTHYGLIRVPAEGEPTLVGDTVQDFMGFTVVGPGHYLASGHPGEGQDAPGNLGLIESTDGGQTWQSLSLAGEADFHALRARHGQVYGYHGGTLMVSDDKKTWQTGAQLPLADFAVSATDPDVILATTEQGLARSTDGGTTFDVTPGAPLLQLVSWPDGELVVGVAPDGTVHVSEDGGASWTERGSVGEQPQALVADGDDIYVALDGALLASNDGGTTFKARYDGR
jgi:photosystem II stability/assembly factor-like uncharacterized protein